VTADCPPPNTTPGIAGPVSICNNAAKIYRLNNVKGDAAVTWSISPSYVANLKQASRMVGVVPTGTAGKAVLTATVVKNGVTTYYNYDIMFGIPTLSGYCFTGPLIYGDGSYDYVPHVSMFPNTVPADYHWYSNGSYVGTGNQRTWRVYPNQTRSFDVHYYGACGESSWYASSQTCTNPDKNGGNVSSPKPSGPRFVLSPNPAKSIISIQRIVADNEAQQGSEAKTPSVMVPNNGVTTIKVFDAQGKLRKTATMNAASARLTVNVSDLSGGLYFVHVIEPGRETVTLKVLLEK
jgi:hypothetical protein